VIRLKIIESGHHPTTIRWGELITNSQNSEYRNGFKSSQRWSRWTLKWGVLGRCIDLRQALADGLRAVADDLEADPEWQCMILQSVEILGVDAIKALWYLLRLGITTSPLNKWVVGREVQACGSMRRSTCMGISLGVPRTGRLKCGSDRTSETSIWVN